MKLGPKVKHGTDCQIMFLWKHKVTRLKTNVKLIHFSVCLCEIDGPRCHEGLEGNKQIEGQVDFIISHPSGVQVVIFSSPSLII